MNPDALRHELEREAQEQSEGLTILRNIPVETQEDYAWACDTLLEVKGRYKALEAREATITKPLWEAWKATKDLFRAPKDALVEMERVLKQKVAAFTQAQEARRVAAMQTQALAIPEPAEAQGVTVREVRKWEVFDAEKVPRAFCSPDPQKIQQAIDAGDTEIPGVRFYMQPVVTARGRK